MNLDKSAITGLVLCGGRGSRMGGVDKGLQHFRGVPLALHTLRRIAPQVGPVMVNANRNLPAYEAMGVPVWPDTLPDHPGPLAGWLAGLARCETPYLLTLPCDTPLFPADLASRLADALAREDADIAMAATRGADGALQAQPVFCLLKTTLMQDLAKALHQGERKVDRWTSKHRRVTVPFDDEEAFANANTVDELARLQGLGPG